MKIAVVGGCASGKTTIAAELRSRGLDAYVVGQEHSGVASLWNHREPDFVVFLEVPLAAVRERRDQNWPEWLYVAQQQRLRQACDSADVRANTADLSVEQTLATILSALPSEANNQESSSAGSSPASASARSCNRSS